MPVTKRRDALREALTGAAERAIAAGGLDGLKAREIAREAGCALGAIYTVFPDLDALVLAVNGRTLAAIDAALRGAAALPDPPARLQALALAYLDYAAAERPRWQALFAHRMAGGRAVPDWYLAEQARLFRDVEAPMAALRPDLEPAVLAEAARTLFSAVHGVVSLGLDEKLVPLPLEALRTQLAALVAAVAAGWRHGTAG